MAPIPDIVQDSKLETRFHSDPEHVQHVRYVTGSTPKQRKVRKEERWKRERWLGRGGFGTVESQICIHGDSKGKVRAVKKMQKVGSSDYYRELEAIALFSHDNVSGLLFSLKSCCSAPYTDCI
jgi:serine/threonine protein kinase